MKHVTMISANMNGFDRYSPPCVQTGVAFDVRCFSDFNFSPRRQTMTPRLQARIPKMFGWDLVPGAEVYVWLDASFRLTSEHSAKWFAESLGQSDLALFDHPHRHSIREEAQHILSKLRAGSLYLTQRYEGEDLDGQLRAVLRDGYEDDTLFATMAFAYHPSSRVKALLGDWWIHTSRFHAVDQLALPYLVWEHGASVARLEGDPYHHGMIEYTRGGNG